MATDKPKYEDGFYAYRIGYEQFPIQIYEEAGLTMTRRIGSSFPTPLDKLAGKVGDRIQLRWSGYTRVEK